MDPNLVPLDGDQSALRPHGSLPRAAMSSSLNFQAVNIKVPPTTITGMQQMIQQAGRGLITATNLHDEPDETHGLSRSWFQKALAQWSNPATFDWPEIESSLNELPQFVCTIKHKGTSYRVHFAALFSSDVDAVPLINFHGWPGCFAEFVPMMKLMQKNSDVPFHFIAPSLPGFLFSDSIETPLDVTIRDVVEIMHQVMEGLGFSGPGQSYIATGGDIGSRVARGLGVVDPACKAVHLNFCYDTAMESIGRKVKDASDQEKFNTIDKFMKSGIGYGIEHATRPGTIGLILSTNPAALLAWIGEKYATWTAPTSRLDMKTILTFTTLYWVTQSLPKSLYPYKGDFNPSRDIPSHGGEDWNIDAPKILGFTSSKYEILPVPKYWVEQTGNLKWFKTCPVGHFAALENPQAFLDDLKDFVTTSSNQYDSKLDARSQV